jgi:RNA 3'-terminal phosphate cyclase (ATP)
METVFVDGSVGEGGGQILRTSLALSCITGKSVHIENIRAARRNPGLAKQHLASVHAACRICGAQDSGAVIGSKVLDFQPGQVQAGDFHFDVGSAGSATLVIQTILPALFLAGKSSTVTVTGGTHNPWAPPYDFLSESFLPAVAAAGFQAACRLIKHGFFPAGGGEITFDIKPWREEQNQIINLCEPIKNSQIYARIYIANLPAHIAQRQERLLLRSKLDIQNIEHFEVTDSVGPGNCVMIRFCCDSRTTVFTAFGMKGKPSEEVISEVFKFAADFLESGAAVDRFLSDQLLIYMALSKTGCFTTNEITSHFQTNVEIIKKFLPVEFNIDQQGKLYRISCVTA